MRGTPDADNDCRPVSSRIAYNAGMSDTRELADEEIVERVRTGEHDLYAMLMERYTRKLLRYAVNLVHDEDGARQVVQDAFVQAYIHLHGFDIRKKFSSWIYRIVHNEAMNAVKKYKNEVMMPPDIDFESEQDIEGEYEQKETALHVEKCIGSLPLIYAEPLSLYYLDGKSYEEISDIVRIPMGTVATRMRRARILMKHLCQKN